MFISVGKGNTDYRPVKMDTLRDLSETITKTNWSCATFKDNYRTIDNFISAESIAIDIDGGVTVEEAARRVKDYSHIIAPSKSHQKEKVTKSGKSLGVADRYRVLFVLDQPITDVEDYYATWNELLNLFPESDPACKDPSRLYYPSNDVLSVKTGGLKIKVKKAEQFKQEKKAIETSRRGQLSRDTLDFLMFGAPNGSRHARLYKAAVDAREQNYPQDEFLQLLYDANNKNGIWKDSEMSDVERTVSDGFSKDPKYAPREVKQPTFNFMPISDLLATKEKMTWVVKDLLSEGGLSLLVGPPKSGKSTLLRQLTKCVARGEKFLKRDVAQGRVLVLALEEQIEMLNSQYKTVGITKKDDILVHVGRINAQNPTEELESVCQELKPKLIIVDTLMLFCKTQNINDYGEMNQKLEFLRDLARKTKVHVICVHHQNKSRDNYGTATILGSAAIHGAVDCAMIFTAEGVRRSIISSQRGGRPFDGEELLYNKDIQQYEIGSKINRALESF